MSPLTPKLFLSGFFGLIYGLLSYILLMDLPGAGRMALICGLGTFATLLLILLLNDSRMARRYERAENLLPGKPHFRVGANSRENGKTGSVNVYLCGNEMILLNVRRREPVLTRIRPEEVRQAVASSAVQLDLTLADGRSLILLTPYMEELIRQLRMLSWPVDER